MVFKFSIESSKIIFQNEKNLYFKYYKISNL